jgi:hypothetical protein
MGNLEKTRETNCRLPPKAPDTIMKKLICLLLLHAATLTLAQTNPNPALPEAPDQLRAGWTITTAPRITLTWERDTRATGGYRIERSVNGGAWVVFAPTVPAPVTSDNTVTFVDPLTDAAVSTSAFKSAYGTFSYRVRPLVSASLTIAYPASEVVTAGIIGQTTPTAVATSFDSDADGIPDSVELKAENGLNPNDWADGMADKDGDMVPNAWEHNMLGGNMNSSDWNLAAKSITPSVTVDASIAADNTTTVKTITTAINRIGAVAATGNPYRLIRVRPGIYKENISNLTTQAATYRIAIVPLYPVVTVNGITETPPTMPIVIQGRGLL